MGGRIRTAAWTVVAAAALFAGAAPATASPDKPTWYFLSPDGYYWADDNWNTGPVPLTCNPGGSQDYGAVYFDGQWGLYGSDTGSIQFFFGRAGDTPLCGDWDGDGVDTVGAVRGNEFFLASANVEGGGAVHHFAFGRAGDQRLAGDWDGDGDDTIALKRGNRYYFAGDNRTGGGSVVTSAFGRADDYPVAGDWEGDGTYTLALRRGNEWIVTYEAPGTPMTAGKRYAFGRATDLPVAGQVISPAFDPGTALGVVRIPPLWVF